MSRDDDDRDNMTDSGAPTDLDDFLVEQLLRGSVPAAEPDLQRLLSSMRAVSSAPAPAPTFALESMLSRGFAPAPPVVRRPPARRQLWRAAAVLVATCTSLVSAAAANALPAPAQKVVVGIVDHVTPFTLPEPHDAVHRAPRHVVPRAVPHAATSAAPTPLPAPALSTTPPAAKARTHSAPVVVSGPTAVPTVPRPTPTPSPRPTERSSGADSGSRGGDGRTSSHGRPSAGASASRGDDGGRHTPAPRPTARHGHGAGSGDGSGSDDGKGNRAHPSQGTGHDKGNGGGDNGSGRTDG
ncbi:hypothetical protein acdb102_25350 [Acidothermaceae bacterium B102]|nr:hypothetical protein acdb102_25350 [Acidothermaceae bacterium B102]